MWIFLRYVAMVAILSVGAKRASAQGSSPPDCAQLKDLDADALPQAFYVAPLVEDASYSITSPGHLNGDHLIKLQDLVDRARCIAQARRLPLAALRLSVYARTDDRGARGHILAELRRRGVSGTQLATIGRSIVDVVAAWHRARVLVERLREEVSRALLADPSLGSVDPAGMVQPSDLISDEPAGLTRIIGTPPQPHLRSFVVLIAARDNLPAGLLATPEPSAAPPATVALPPIIQVSCCDVCEGRRRASVEERDAEHTSTRPSGPWLGAPQFDALVGAAIGVESYTREYLYRELAWLGLGLRLPIRRLELGVRLSFHGGSHPVTFNYLQQDQLRLGGGAALQFGVLAVQHARARLALGAEVGWVYLFRRIERIDFPYQGLVDSKQIHAPQAGGYLRLDLPFPRLPRLALAAELSLGVMPFSSEDNAPANLTAKALGGITYALR